MENKFTSIMAGKTDQFLKEILMRPTDYVPEARSAAFEVLAGRGVSPEELENLKILGEKQKLDAEIKAGLPLETNYKALYFVFSFVALTPFVAIWYRHYAEQGYDRKSADSFQFTVLGLLFYGAIFSVLRKIFEWF